MAAVFKGILHSQLRDVALFVTFSSMNIYASPIAGGMSPVGNLPDLVGHSTQQSAILFGGSNADKEVISVVCTRITPR